VIEAGTIIEVVLKRVLARVANRATCILSIFHAQSSESKPVD